MISLRFGSSGIRGRYPETVNSSTALELGELLPRKMGGLLALGHDPRFSGQVLKAAFLARALQSSARILDYGLVPTPAVAFETRSQNASGGVMITASHNPPEYNGFKIFNSQGEALRDETFLEGEQDSALKPNFRGVSPVRAVERFHPSSYTSMLAQIRFRKKWKVVLDPGNGAACALSNTVYSGLLDGVTSINSVPDGSFAARGSEPTRESEKMLSSIVLQTKADIGIAFDGDGDRMFVIDEKGDSPLQDRVLGSYIAYLSKSSKGPFLVPMDTSMVVDEVAERHGARLIRGPVGDASLLKEMKNYGANFGGEPSGAWINYDRNPTPDGILSGLLYLKSVEEEGKTVSEQLKSVPEYHMMRQSIKNDGQAPKKMLDALSFQMLKILGNESSLATKFGLRVSTPSSWVLVRESGTEPVIRVTGEAKHAGEVRRIMRETIRAIRRVMKGRD